MSRKLLSVAALGAVAALVLAFSAPALAHEQRLVTGKYSFVVGWGDEPTYTGFKNSVQLILSDADKKPITDLGDTLQVEVSTGEQKMTLPLEANFEVGEFGEPGDYRGWMVPTRPGTYTFHFTGTIRGDKIDETFTSSDTTFSSVKNADEVEFPVKDPSTGDLATNLARLTPRVDKALSDAKADADDASTAQTIGIIALVVGVVLGGAGVVLGITARRKTT